jgi:hypothetical protein
MRIYEKFVYNQAYSQNKLLDYEIIYLGNYKNAIVEKNLLIKQNMVL